MWLITNKGAFSATRSKQEPRKIQIRSRWEKDLQALRTRHNYLRGAIIETPHADYQFRIICTIKQWQRVVADEALAIDYFNFKDSCHENPDMDDKPLMEIWSIINRAAKRAHPRGWDFLTEAVRNLQEDDEGFDPNWVQPPFEPYDRACACPVCGEVIEREDQVPTGSDELPGCPHDGAQLMWEETEGEMEAARAQAEAEAQAEK